MPTESAKKVPEEPFSRTRDDDRWLSTLAERERIDVTVPHRSRSSDLIRRHVSQVPGDERTVREGIPVTTAPRTIFDLAATEPADVIQNLLREAEFLELWDRLSLWDLVERYPGKRGVRRVRARSIASGATSVW